MKNFNIKCRTIFNRKVYLLGNEHILQMKKISIFVSRSIPLNIIIPAEKFLLSLDGLDFAYISGWHSPFEKRILKKILMHGKKVIFFTSKGIKEQAIYSYLNSAIREERLLIASLLLNESRITSYNSQKRNEFISELADYNIFMFINKGGNLENLFNKLLSQRKAPLIFNHSANSEFLRKGKPIGLENFREVLS